MRSMTFEYVNHFRCYIVRFLWCLLVFQFHHVFSDASARTHQSPGLNLAANAATSFALCIQNFCIAYLCPMNLVEPDKTTMRSSNNLIEPVQVKLSMFLMSIVPAPGIRAKRIAFLKLPNPMFRQIRVRPTHPCSSHTSSNFVAQLLDGSGFETPTHNVESERTWTCILISFVAGSPSNLFVTNGIFFQSCHSCILYASLHIVHRHSFELLVILA